MTIASDLDSEGCMESIDLILKPGTMEQQAIASCMATGGCCQAARDACMCSSYMVKGPFMQLLIKTQQHM